MVSFLQQKTLLVVMFTFIALTTSAQQTTITRYFDYLWNKTSPDSACFYTNMVKDGSVYHCTSYWMRSKQLNCIAAYADTNFVKPVGLLKRYYENGYVEDSSFLYESGQLKNTWHFYPNGKLFVHYSYDLKNDKGKTEAYNENGTIIDDFVYTKEASYRIPKAWVQYLAENINTNTPVNNGSPAGTYHVIIRFIVDINGKVQEAVAETNNGYGMEEEALRVIKKSPNWDPAVYLGKKMNAYRRQPITFVVKKNRRNLMFRN